MCLVSCFCAQELQCCCILLYCLTQSFLPALDSHCAEPSATSSDATNGLKWESELETIVDLADSFWGQWQVFRTAKRKKATNPKGDNVGGGGTAEGCAGNEQMRQICPPPLPATGQFLSVSPSLVFPLAPATRQTSATKLVNKGNERRTADGAERGKERPATIETQREASTLR